MFVFFCDSCMILSESLVDPLQRHNFVVQVGTCLLQIDYPQLELVVRVLRVSELVPAEGHLVLLLCQL